MIISKQLLRSSLLLSKQNRILQHIPFRNLSSNSSNDGPHKQETLMTNKLREALQTSDVEVIDTSGGCGSMYSLEVSSELFRGLPMVKQHRMVQEVIRKEIGEMHGLTITTKVPSSK